MLSDKFDKSRKTVAGKICHFGFIRKTQKYKVTMAKQKAKKTVFYK